MIPVTAPIAAAPPAAGEVRPAVTFGEALRFWLKLGFVSFGGPAGQIAIMHRELVERRRWISEGRFLHALNYCMLLPGPEAQQLATYIGWLLHRVPGGLAAGALFVLPSALLLLGLSYAYAAHGDAPAVAGVLWGIRPVVVAVVFEAVLRIGRRAIRRRAHLVLASAAFAGIALLDLPFPVLVVGAAVAGWAGSRVWPEAFAGRPGEGGASTEAPDALRPVIDDAAVAAPHVRPSLRRLVRTLAVGLALWLAGLALVLAVRGPGSLHGRQYTFFTQAALVTFGGAYAVLGYVAQAAVGSFGWLSEAQTVDGLALAETTPGPLIMVLQFVGFVAAWNHPEGLTPLSSALVGALVTTFVTFLPCFVLVFAGAPYVEGLRAHRGLGAALGGVTAAVVGVVLHLALVLGGAILVPSDTWSNENWMAPAVAAAAFLALWRLRVDVGWVVLAGGLLGLLRGGVG